SAAPLWTQTYGYDNYGNRTSVNSNGYSAKQSEAPTDSRQSVAMNRSAIAHPSAPRVDLPTDLLATNYGLALPPFLRDDSQPISDSPPTLLASSPPPSSGPPTFTDDPLVAGVSVVKALHITELRDAINELRTRAGLSTASWAESL